MFVVAFGVCHLTFTLVFSSVGVCLFQVIWNLLTKVKTDAKYDSLACTSIRFLTSVVSKPHYGESL